MCADRGAAPKRRRTRSEQGFSLIEALMALVVVGGAVAAVLPPLARALGAKAGRDAGVSATLFAQSLLEAHAPPGATRPGRWEGAAPGGARRDRKSTSLNSRHANTSYALFCLEKKNIE